MNELINIDAINDFISDKQWTSYRFSKELGLDYSFVYRVLKKEVNGGNKFISRLIEFCNNNKISPSEFIFLKMENKPNLLKPERCTELEQKVAELEKRVAALEGRAPEQPKLKNDYYMNLGRPKLLKPRLLNNSEQSF